MWHASIPSQREEGGIEQIEFEDEDVCLRQLDIDESAKHRVEVNT